MNVSIVVPVYNSEQSLPDLVRRIDAVMSRTAVPYEVVLVNDGSRDGSWQRVQQFASEHSWIIGIDLMRNYGQHNALLCGIRAAQHEIIVTLDDDLQHPPEEIPKLLECLAEQYDVVYGVPLHRQHGLWRDMASYVTRLTLQEAMGAKSASKVSAFRAFRRDLREGFADFRGPYVSLDVLLTWSTTKFGSIVVNHHPRHAGKSNYTFFKLVEHSLNMMTGFSTLPLQLASMIGFASTIFGMVLLFVVIGRYLVYGGVVPGFAFLASALAIFSGAQLFAIGIFGEYLARMHFRIMDRPAYAVPQHPRQELSRMSQHELIEYLPWDFEFFGYRIARVKTHQLNEEAGKQILEWARDEKIDCVYLLADPESIETVTWAETSGARLMDIRAILYRTLPMTLPEERLDPAATIGPGTLEDVPALRSIARVSYKDTRFNWDPFLRAKSAELYETWIAKSIEEGYADHTLVARINGVPAGYLTLDCPTPETASMGISAVAPEARGKGIATQFVRLGIDWLQSHGAVGCTNIIQGRNRTAFRLYQKFGFKFEQLQLWYHLWLNR